MRIRWGNLIGAILALVIVVLLIRYHHPVMAFLSGIERIGPGYSRDDHATGLMVVGISGAVLVAIVKILTQRQDK